MTDNPHYSIEEYGVGFLVADYSGNRGSMGAAYCGSDGKWNSQPTVNDPFPDKDAAEKFVEDHLESDMLNTWTKSADAMPPTKRIVMTRSPNGQEQALYFDSMWWITDGSMYVYYHVVEWREMTAQENRDEATRLSKKADVATKEASRLRSQATDLSSTT